MVVVTFCLRLSYATEFVETAATASCCLQSAITYINSDCNSFEVLQVLMRISIGIPQNSSNAPGLSLLCEAAPTDTQECLALHVLLVCLSADTELQLLFFSFLLILPSPSCRTLFSALCCFDEHAWLPPHSHSIIFYILHCFFSPYLLHFFVVASLLSPSLRFFCFPLPAFLPPPPLQACKPNHNAESGGSGQSLPPHVGSLGQAEDQSCPSKRRRASSPTKVNTTMVSFSCFSYNRQSYTHAI